jgi:predicted Rossmann-fold nucleotide-binding protein
VAGSNRASSADQLAEALTWTQLGLQDKPCGLLDVEAYFQPLLTWLDLAVSEGFLKQEHRDLVIHSTSPATLLDQLGDWRPVVVDKWIR